MATIASQVRPLSIAAPNRLSLPTNTAVGGADEAEQADGEGEREQGLAAEQAGVVVEVAGVGAARGRRRRRRGWWPRRRLPSVVLGISRSDQRAVGRVLRINRVFTGLTPSRRPWNGPGSASTRQPLSALDDLFQGVSVVVGDQGSCDWLAGVVVVPDRGGQGEDALQHARDDACRGVPTVAFQVELAFEGVVDRLDDLP